LYMMALRLEDRDMDYGVAHDGTVYTPNGTTGLDSAGNDDRNAAIEAAELARWATAPAEQVAYYRFADDTVTTWRGVVIGRIVSANVYRHNFGGRFVSVRVMGTNGAEYHGRASWDNGTVIRLRRVR
jgi:hypothetical protein